jgi:hypothetical protein
VQARDKIQAALSERGASEIPAVLCYDWIYFRDRWWELTLYPWWYRNSPSLDHQVAWYRQALSSTCQDWFTLPLFYTHEEQTNLTVEVRSDGVFLVDLCSDQARRLQEPIVGGWPASDRLPGPLQQVLPRVPEEIDVVLESTPGSYWLDARDNGRIELARRLVQEFGDQLYPVYEMSSPLWGCFDLWGFEGWMTMIARRPDLVEHACYRFYDRCVAQVHMAASMGAAGIWVDESMADQISPKAFEALGVPFMRALVQEIRANGMSSVYYFCGNPAGRWDQILSIPADALGFEESKKGFTIDLKEVVDRVRGQRTLLGNLDAIGILEKGSEEQLGNELARQLAAGRKNGSRFIMSVGSPVTPGTPVERVRFFCALAHELGSR